MGLRDRPATQTSTATFDPQLRAAFLSNVNTGNAVASQPFQPFTGERFAGFTAPEQAAQGQLLNFSQSNVGGGLFDAAQQAAMGAGTYTPSNVNGTGYNPAMASSQAPVAFNAASNTNAGVTNAQAANAGPAALTGAAQVARGDIRDVSGGQPINQSQLDAYMNPYSDSVVSLTMADIERQRQEREALNNSRARAQGAFGGSGAAVAASLDNDRFDRQSALTSAELRSRGFDTALGAAQQDVGRGLQAQLANQGVDAGVAGQNAGLLSTANLANQTSRNNQSQFNAGLLQQAGLANAGAANTASLANADSANRVSQFNSSGLLDASRFNAGQGQEISLANQNAANRAGEFGASQSQAAQLANQSAGLQGAAQRQDAAALMGRLSDQQIDQSLQRISAAQSVGEAQRLFEQQMLDFGFQQHEAAQMWPILMQELRNQSTGLLPSSPLTTSSGTGQQPGLLSGIGSAAQGIGSVMALSDGRLKTDIQTLHHDHAGRRWVSYRYLWDDEGAPLNVGLIAQEVRETDPDAVVELASGYLAVNYGELH